MMLYIGADNELQNNQKQPIYIQELDCSYDDDNFANNTLAKKYKYQVMIDGGCACDFAFDYTDNHFNKLPKIVQKFTSKPEYDKERKEVNDNRKQYVESLFEYIRTNVINDSCELLSFWTGDFQEKDKTTLNLRNFEFEDSFKFAEEHITVFVSI